VLRSYNRARQSTSAGVWHHHQNHCGADLISADQLLLRVRIPEDTGTKPVESTAIDSSSMPRTSLQELHARLAKKQDAARPGVIALRHVVGASDGLPQGQSRRRPMDEVDLEGA
jgi:hypothetical protein